MAGRSVDERVPKQLFSAARRRCEEKMKMVVGIDPCTVSSSCYCDSVDKWTEIEIHGIVMNFLLDRSERSLRSCEVT